MNKGLIFGLTAVCIWSGFILVSRYGGIGPLLPYDMVAIRYATCSLLLLPVWLFYKPFPLFTRHNIIGGLVGGLAYAFCVFQGFALVPASHAAIMLPGLLPLVIGLLSFALREESFNRNKWLSLVVITAAIVMLLLQAINGPIESIDGYFWLMAGAIFWGTFSILVRRWHINPWQATVSLAMITALFYLPVYIIWLPKGIHLGIWQDVVLQAFYQGFLATIVQMICYVKAIQILGARRQGSLMALVPIIAGLSATVLFAEPLHWVLLLSLFLVSFGVWVGNRG